MLALNHMVPHLGKFDQAEYNNDISLVYLFVAVYYSYFIPVKLVWSTHNFLVHVQ